MKTILSNSVYEACAIAALIGQGEPPERARQLVQQRFPLPLWAMVAELKARGFPYATEQHVQQWLDNTYGDCAGYDENPLVAAELYYPAWAVEKCLRFWTASLVFTAESVAFVGAPHEPPSLAGYGGREKLLQLLRDRKAADD